VGSSAAPAEGLRAASLRPAPAFPRRRGRDPRECAAPRRVWCPESEAQARPSFAPLGAHRSGASSSPGPGGRGRRPPPGFDASISSLLRPDNFCRLVLPTADPLWRGDFRHSLQVTVTQGRNGIRRHGTSFDVTCSQEECRHGSSGMGGSRRVPPFVFRKSLFRRPQPALRGRGSRLARLSR